MEERKHAERESSGFWVRVICGFLIGVGGILPGVSGSVLAVSFGIYAPMIEALAGFFKAPRKNIRFLLPIGIGALTGIMLCAVLLSSLMKKYEAQIMYLFLGLVLGGMPSFIKEANSGGFKARYLIATFIGAAAASTLFFLDGKAVSASENAALSPLAAALSGAIVTAGALIPGISTAVVLMFLGWYAPMMKAVSSVLLAPLLFFGLGALAAALLFLKLTSWALKRFHGWVCYGTLGFLIISALLLVRLLLPFTADLRQLVCVLLFALGFGVAMLSDTHFQ